MDLNAVSPFISKYGGDSVQDNASGNNEDSDDNDICENERTIVEWLIKKSSTQASCISNSNQETSYPNHPGQDSFEQTEHSKQRSNISKKARHLVSVIISDVADDENQSNVDGDDNDDYKEERRAWKNSKRQSIEKTEKSSSNLVQVNIMNVRNDDNQSNIDGIDDGYNDSEEYRAWKRSESMSAKTTSEKSSSEKVTYSETSVSSDISLETGTYPIHSDTSEHTIQGNKTKNPTKKDNIKTSVDSKPGVKGDTKNSGGPKSNNKSDKTTVVGQLAKSTFQAFNTSVSENPNTKADTNGSVDPKPSTKSDAKTSVVPNSKKPIAPKANTKGDTNISKSPKPSAKGDTEQTSKASNSKTPIAPKANTKGDTNISKSPKPITNGDTKTSVDSKAKTKGDTPKVQKPSTNGDAKASVDQKPIANGDAETSMSPTPNTKDDTMTSSGSKPRTKRNAPTSVNPTPSYSTSTLSNQASNHQIRKRSNRNRYNRTSPQKKLSTQSQKSLEQDISEPEPSNERECNERFKEAVTYLSQRCATNYIIAEVEKLKQMEKCINACGRQIQPTSCEYQEDKQSCVKQRQTSNQCDVDEIETCAADPPCDLDKFTRWSKEIFSLCSLPRDKNIVIKMTCANAQNDDCVEDTSTDSQQICKSDLFIDGTGNTRRLKICIDSDPANDPQTSQECESECECELNSIQYSRVCAENMKYACQAKQMCHSLGGFNNEPKDCQIIYFRELLAIMIAIVIFLFLLVTFQ